MCWTLEFIHVLSVIIMSVDVSLSRAMNDFDKPNSEQCVQGIYFNHTIGRALVNRTGSCPIYDTGSPPQKSGVYLQWLPFDTYIVEWSSWINK